jgi:hypothetical protein
MTSSVTGIRIRPFTRHYDATWGSSAHPPKTPSQKLADESI